MDRKKIMSPQPQASMAQFNLTLQPTFGDKLFGSQRRSLAFLTLPKLGERLEAGEPRPVLEAVQIPGGWKTLLMGILGMPALPPSETRGMSLP